MTTTNTKCADLFPIDETPEGKHHVSLHERIYALETAIEKIARHLEWNDYDRRVRTEAFESIRHLVDLPEFPK